MLTRHLLLDSVLAVGLFAALIVVVIVERNSPVPEGTASKGDLLGTKRTTIPMREDSPYAERTAENREEIAIRHGASIESERAVQSGLNWLSRHQGEDGSWSNNCLGAAAGSRCEKGGVPCQDPGGAFPFAQTGFALLAFQAGGHYTFNNTLYSLQVKRGLDWIVSGQQKDGSFSVPGQGWAQHSMYEHAIATFALAEACAIAKDFDQQPTLQEQQALEKAVKFIEDYQDSEGGGWRYSPKMAGDASVSGWVVLALKSAIAAGVKVDPDVLKKCNSFFENLASEDGRSGYTNRGDGSNAMTGVGMLFDHFLRATPAPARLKAASKYLADFVEKNGMQHDYYMLYNCTLGMYLAGGKNWEDWNNVVRKGVVELQLNKGCERGSWTPEGMEQAGGRICSTALAILTLEVYYRFAKKE